MPDIARYQRNARHQGDFQKGRVIGIGEPAHGKGSVDAVRRTPEVVENRDPVVPTDPSDQLRTCEYFPVFCKDPVIDTDPDFVGTNSIYDSSGRIHGTDQSRYEHVGIQDDPNHLRLPGPIPPGRMYG